MPSSFTVRRQEIAERIALAAQGSPLAAAGVTLLAVSKGQPERRVEEALAAGQRHFAENRVQEAMARWHARREAFPDLRLHLIGPLQTNKVREALGLFDVIHTVDRASLAEAVAREMDRSGRRPECFVQVNLGREKQKSGAAPEETDRLVAYCRTLGLPVEGLMCIPPQDAPPGPYFALLRRIAQRNGLVKLSMGMSGDFETAVKFGATHVRIGTALFGERVSSEGRGARGK